ncbi:unnamed protein product [Brassica oleracea var. botrytis]|uniref:Uncharacterized protein n=3 Tax=Brassica TaxID=3705 RepID=A0A0D3DK78_BRAOL|nr:unnamed protein product [Brassica napus]VDD54319.1 unnamed protein product [Brassica oleracea]
MRSSCKLISWSFLVYCSVMIPQTYVSHPCRAQPMLLISDPQIIEFLCKAKVTGIHAYKGWCYIGCSSERFLLSHSSYHVELCVSDELDEAVFVAFDMEMEKLANIQAAEAAQILGACVNAHVDNELPHFVA